MHFVKQLSVFVENKLGRLSDILEVIGQEGIDISAMAIADTTEFGILRMIVNEPQKACIALKEAGVAVKVTDVIALAVPDTPGGLAKEVKKLKEAGVGIEYMYAFIGKSDDGGMVIARVDNTEEALAALKDSDLQIVDPQDVYRL